MNYKKKFKGKVLKSRNTLFLVLMKKVLLVLGILVVCITLAFLGCIKYYKDNIGPVSSSEENVSFIIEEGDTYYSISSKLKNAGLIKSEDIYKIYIKLNKPATGLKVGEYTLRPNMGIEEILSYLSDSKNAISTDIQIGFVEGKNMRYIASVIANNTTNTEEDVFNLLKDEKYLNELIETYWFIDKSILNKDIYYSLEGYLYPNTYNFKDKDVTVKEIFKVMLDEEAKQLESYKAEIQKSKYTYHELLTLASIIELEAGNDEYRAEVASVFYNRLAINMSLGSDVTTYYASKVDMGERDLYVTELQAVNAYNTRSDSMAGKLPVGPICNPSISNIEAVLRPAKTKYLYFVADKKGEVHFTKTYNEHLSKIQELKDKGLWFEY